MGDGRFRGIVSGFMTFSCSQFFGTCMVQGGGVGFESCDVWTEIFRGKCFFFFFWEGFFGFLRTGQVWFVPEFAPDNEDAVINETVPSPSCYVNISAGCHVIVAPLQGAIFFFVFFLFFSYLQILRVTRDLLVLWSGGMY